MKEILNKLHLSIKEFAELYEIPYNTVRQWANEERKMPEYLKKLIEKDINRKTQGKQLEIDGYKEWYWLQFSNKYGTAEHLCYDEQEREKIIQEQIEDYHTTEFKTKNLIEYLDK